MITQENRNLLVAYSITLAIAVFLLVVIANFNDWFFPNDELKLSEFTPSSRGMISERDLRFGLLSDQKFTSLEPILDSTQLQEETNPSTTTVRPVVRQPIELRRGNPFQPF